MKEDETPTGNHPLFFVGIFYPQKKILALVKTNNNMFFCICASLCVPLNKVLTFDKAKKASFLLHLCFLGVPLNKVLTLDKAKKASFLLHLCSLMRTFATEI